MRKPVLRQLPKPSSRSPTRGKRAPVRMRQPIPVMAEVPPDPLAGVEYPGDLQGDADVELGALGKAFRDAKNDDKLRYFRLASAGYYFVAVFEDELQCAEFIGQLGVPAMRDKRFIDGRMLADALGLELTHRGSPYTKNPRRPKRLLDLVKPEKRR